ncbi:hypothetical protein [Desulfofundulus sp.]|uniref:hypothetical protein n=1 Tax=Desulfofundulus sp. TaxID=2282750 RepID=UPI003C747A3C
MKKVKFIGLALLLALALMGAAFAAWSNTLTGNATLETGTLDSSIAPGTVSDNDPEGLDVANVTATAGEDGKSIAITVNNAYPGYEARVPFTVSNNGTIPVDVSDLTFTGVPEALTVTDDFGGANDLAPGGNTSGAITVKVGDGAEQHTTYTFTAKIDVSQFNAH